MTIMIEKGIMLVYLLVREGDSKLIHIQNLFIQNYRGIKDLNLQNLGRINLLMGRNNIGKTSVLEAIELVLNPGDASKFAMVSRGRDRAFSMLRKNISLLDSMQWTFPLNYFDGKTGEYSRDDIELFAELRNQQVEYKIHCEQDVIYLLNEQGEEQALELTFLLQLIMK